MNKHCPACLRQVPIAPGGKWGKHRVGPSKKAEICPLSGTVAVISKRPPKRKPQNTLKNRRPIKPALLPERRPPKRKICPKHGLALVARQTKYGTRWGCPMGGCTVVLWGGSTSTPADEETRAARMRAHAAFDPLWSPREHGSRTRLYRALAAFMGLPPAEAHIGMFDATQCEQVIEFCSIFAANPAAFQESSREAK